MIYQLLWASTGLIVCAVIQGGLWLTARGNKQ